MRMIYILAVGPWRFMTNPMCHWGQCSRLKGVTSESARYPAAQGRPRGGQGGRGPTGKVPGLLNEVIAFDERQRAAGRQAAEY